MAEPMTPQAKPPGKFRAAIIQLFGGSASMPNETFREALVTSTSAASGQSVNDVTMLSLSTVWACARLVSETIATLPLKVYERTPDGRRAVPTHPLQMIIGARPNSDTTAAVYWESTVAAMLLRGNARSEKLYIGDRLVGLRFLHPARLSITYKADGTAVYVYTEADGKRREIPPARIFNVPGFSLDGVSGASVIAYGANVFGSALAADQVAAKTFANGLMPTTYFKYPQILRDTQREEARVAIKAISGSLNSGSPAILEAGMETGSIGINPNDAQLLESRAFSVEEVCRWFRVPPFMVGHTSTSTSWGTGIEQQMLGFLMFTLRPWLTRIEQAIAKDLIAPAEQGRIYAEFAVEGLLRGDTQARANYYSTALQNGWLNRNQVARMENLPEIPGGDIHTVQSALVPLDQLGRNNSGAPQ